MEEPFADGVDRFDSSIYGVVMLLFGFAECIADLSIAGGNLCDRFAEESGVVDLGVFVEVELVG